MPQARVLASERVKRPRPMTAALMAAALLLTSIPVQTADLPPLRSETRPAFSADIVVSSSGSGPASVSVTIAVPREQLQWLKRPSGYAAAAEYAVVFHPGGRGRDHGDLWERHYGAPDFASTGATGPAFLEGRTVPLPAGHYEVRVTVKDLHARTQAVAIGRVTVEDRSKMDLAITDLELGYTNQGTFVPLPSRRYGLNSVSLAARASVRDKKSGAWPREYAMVRRIRDEFGTVRREERGTARIPAAGEPVVFRPDSVDLFLGSYVIELEIERPGAKARERRSFEIEESRPPRGREMERLIGPLSYISEPGEEGMFRHRSPEQLEESWMRFWQRRDPTPDTPVNETQLEFMRRVAYAHRNFREQDFGWESDRGRIHIKYGPPDYVETREASSTLGPLLIWTYERPGRRFVFEDRQGFGRYILVEGDE